MKRPLTTLALPFVGFALGWMVKPTAEIPTHQSDQAVPHGDSLLENTISTRSTSTPTGDATETFAAFVEIFKKNRYTIAAHAYQLVSRYSSAELESLAESLVSFRGDERQRRLLIQTIIGRWGEIDPERLFAYALESPIPSFRSTGVYHAIEELSHRAPTRARALIETIEDDNLYRRVSHQVVLAMSKDDARATLATLKEDPTSTHVYDDLFTGWGEQAPLEAAEQLTAITNRNHRRQAIQGLAQSWGKTDPDAAVGWASALHNHQERVQAIEYIMGVVTDIDKGAQLLESLDLNGSTRHEAVRAFATNAIHRDIDSALTWLASLTKGDRSLVLEYNLNSIARSYPERAIHLLKSNLNGRLENAAGSLARQLANTDLTRAQAWVDSLPSGRIKDRAVQGILKELQNAAPQIGAAFLDQVGLDNKNNHLASGTALAWFDRDQGAALAWIESQDDPQIAQQLTHDVIAHWSLQDPAAAVAHAARIDDPESQARALQSCMANWASINPQEAIAHYATLGESDSPAIVSSMVNSMAFADVDAATDLLESSRNTYDDSLSLSTLASSADHLMNTWARFDVIAAAEWSNTLSQPEVGKRAIQRAATDWIAQDSLAASEWIGDLPAGPGRDGPVSELIRHIRHEDPSTTFAWANSIGDERSRTSELRTILNQWKTTDPNAATQALQSADVSTDAYNNIARDLAN